jgi:hypothetical protein
MPRNFVKGFLKVSNIKQQQKCSITRKFAGFGFGKVDEEKDPGAVEGTKLRVLKYPHPLVGFHPYLFTYRIE